MKKITSLEEIDDKRIAITIGNFDGVHIGHQYVINKIKDNKKNDDKLVVVTFNPHPTEVLSPRENYLINNSSEKFKMLESLGVDYLLEIEFTRDLSTLSGEQFLERYFTKKDMYKSFFLGYDFSFGANKKDGVEIIEKFCLKNEYSFLVLDRKEVSELSISSSQIRECILGGKVEEANKLLGRDFTMSGVIVKGEGRGKQIGFPTANLKYPATHIVPAKGVYETSTLYQGGVYKSITNIGVKPTFEDEAELTVETFILNFDKDIYGENFNLIFHKKQRDEKKFSSVNDLIIQIGLDVEMRRKND
ncbi:MAG: riboflavin kinase/FMN adenylyltransferase [Bacteriovoracaceae bacterium]